MAKYGCLRIFEIEIGGAVVATRLGFVLGKELYIYYGGYHPNWGKYSIMTTLVRGGDQMGDSQPVREF